MTITKEKLEEILADAPISYEDKQEIMAAQVAGLEEDKILQMIEVKLVQAAYKIGAQDPEIAKELSEIQEEYAKEVAASDEEFNNEMASIEKELKDLEQKTGQELDQIRMDEIKENINKSV